MKNIMAFGISFLLIGCALTVKMPANRFDSPEAIGKQWRVGLNAGMGEATNVVLTSDYTSTRPNTTAPAFSETLFITLGAGIGLLEMLDFEFKNFNTIQLKYQILGDGRLKADTGNFSLSITAAGGLKSNSGNSRNTITNGTGNYSLKETVYDTAIILGYRPSKFALLYGGYFYTNNSFSGYTEVTTFSPTRTDFSSSAKGFGPHFGVEFGNNTVQGKVETVYFTTQSGIGNNYNWYLGGSVAVHIGKKAVE